jgi:hypothetical protein
MSTWVSATEMARNHRESLNHLHELRDRIAVWRGPEEHPLSADAERASEKTAYSDGRCGRRSFLPTGIAAPGRLDKHCPV